MKTCNTCNKTLPVSEFRERKDRPGTLQPFCKPCSTKEVVNRYFANKKSCIQYKGNTCEDCGLQAHDDNLKMFDFHHLEPEHKDFNISDVRGQSYTSVLRELDKCALLCANCHTKRHLDMKLEEGYHNKLEGNTERFKEVRHEKLTHACKGDIKCFKCEYDDCEEALIISFQGEDKKFYKYNRNPENWSEEFKEALDNSSIVCKNCHRVSLSGTV